MAGREPGFRYPECEGEVREERLAKGVAVVLEVYEGLFVRLERGGEGLLEVVVEGFAEVECSVGGGGFTIWLRVSCGRIVCSVGCNYSLFDVCPFLHFGVEFFDAST